MSKTTKKNYKIELSTGNSDIVKITNTMNPTKTTNTNSNPFRNTSTNKKSMSLKIKKFLSTPKNPTSLTQQFKTNEQKDNKPKIENQIFNHKSSEENNNINNDDNLPEQIKFFNQNNFKEKEENKTKLLKNKIEIFNLENKINDIRTEIDKFQKNLNLKDINNDNNKVNNENIKRPISVDAFLKAKEKSNKYKKNNFNPFYINNFRNYKCSRKERHYQNDFNFENNYYIKETLPKSIINLDNTSNNLSYKLNYFKTAPKEIEPIYENFQTIFTLVDENEEPIISDNHKILGIKIFSLIDVKNNRVFDTEGNAIYVDELGNLINYSDLSPFFLKLGEIEGGGAPLVNSEGLPLLQTNNKFLVDIYNNLVTLPSPLFRDGIKVIGIPAKIEKLVEPKRINYAMFGFDCEPITMKKKFNNEEEFYEYKDNLNINDNNSKFITSYEDIDNNLYEIEEVLTALRVRPLIGKDSKEVLDTDGNNIYVDEEGRIITCNKMQKIILDNGEILVDKKNRIILGLDGKFLLNEYKEFITYNESLILKDERNKKIFKEKNKIESENGNYEYIGKQGICFDFDEYLNNKNLFRKDLLYAIWGNSRICCACFSGHSISQNGYSNMNFSPYVKGIKRPENKYNE